MIETRPGYLINAKVRKIKSVNVDNFGNVVVGSCSIVFTDEGVNTVVEYDFKKQVPYSDEDLSSLDDEAGSIARIKGPDGVHSVTHYDAIRPTKFPKASSSSELSPSISEN